MTPTPKLRWVERKTWFNLPGGPPDGNGNALVLQQWWCRMNNWAEFGGEWRDVPIEKEES